MYHLIKARVQKKMGHPDESVNTMQAAMNLPGVKKAGGKTCYTRVILVSVKKHQPQRCSKHFSLNSLSRQVFSSSQHCNILLTLAACGIVTMFRKIYHFFDDITLHCSSLNALNLHTQWTTMKNDANAINLSSRLLKRI